MLWTMVKVRARSGGSPFAGDPEASGLALWLFSYADLLGVLGPGTTIGSAKALSTVIAALREQGIGRSVVARSVEQHGEDPARMRDVVASVHESVEMSPMPELEWPPIIEMLDDDLLVHLLGISHSSLRRYATRTRSTPDDVAARLHLLMLLVTDLAGSYNHYGIRRWFVRPRAQLGGRSPRDVLGAGFDPEGEPVAQVRSLSAALLGAGAT